MRPPLKVVSIAEAEANFRRLLHSQEKHDRQGFTRPTTNTELTQAKDIYATGEYKMGQHIPPCPTRKGHQKQLLETAIEKVANSIRYHIIKENKSKYVKIFSDDEIIPSMIPNITKAITDRGYECKYQEHSLSNIKHNFTISIPDTDTEDEEIIEQNQFKYTAMNASGKEKKGIIEAPNEAFAQNLLKNEGLFPMSISTLSTTIVEKKKKTKGPKDYYYEAMNGIHIHETGYLKAESVKEAQRFLKTKGLFAIKIEQITEGKKESKAKEDAKRLVEVSKTKLSDSAKSTTTSLSKLLSMIKTKTTNFIKEVKQDW
jgi:hypothetical protein